MSTAYLPEKFNDESAACIYVLALFAYLNPGKFKFNALIGAIKLFME